MLRATQSAASTVIRRQAAALAERRSGMASKAGPLEADSGGLATKAHHAMTTFLLVGTPVLFMVPDSYTDGAMNRTFGAIIALNISAHSWVGLNYVATDYAPKISKSFVGPARYLSAGIGIITLLGLGKIALVSPGGIKGTIKGLWNPPPKGDKK
jgi:succinate dehydrogenase hydrophobic anchor subunit|uniref:Succinate dehydrogenase [ubiquinone] cytochrome b small subunit n=1 Tax=Attheya septentrionalis TaxID=420275 RepID=A0A6T7JA58_9STRA|mmetsp:Transcript_29479/g.54020  ORF Transcript_29479/g.54020 Transcript_29479/m.54020 type:complete len:155 (+) Transcript_29479:84-548(+)